MSWPTGIGQPTNEYEHMQSTIRVGGYVAFVLFAGGMAACATAGKDLGDVRVAASPPRTSTQVINDYTFHITSGEIALESPGNPTVFDLAEGSDGCLRGNVNKAGNLQEICRVSGSNGQASGAAQWKSATSTLVFSVQLSADRSRILIDAGASRGEFLLGKGVAADELRRHPELLAAAFAYGYLPPANATDDGPMLDYRYIVSSAK
jgi:hypothetical protein